MWPIWLAHPFPGVRNANTGLLHLIQSSVEQMENITNFHYGLREAPNLLN